MVRKLIISTVFVFFYQLILADKIDFLNQMPPTEKVLSETKGSNEMDTKARQVASLRVLYKMRSTLRAYIEARGVKLELDKNDLLLRYTDAAFRILQYTKNKYGLNNSDYQNWDKQAREYEKDIKFRDQLMNQFFSRTWQINYLQVVERIKEEQNIDLQKNTDEIGNQNYLELYNHLKRPWYKKVFFYGEYSTLLWISIAFSLIIISTILLLKNNSNLKLMETIKFENTNSLGILEFKSIKAKENYIHNLNSLKRKKFMLALFLGIGLILVSFILVFINFFLKQ